MPSDNEDEEDEEDDDDVEVLLKKQTSKNEIKEKLPLNMSMISQSTTSLSVMENTTATTTTARTATATVENCINSNSSHNSNSSSISDTNSNSGSSHKATTLGIIETPIIPTFVKIASQEESIIRKSIPLLTVPMQTLEKSVSTPSTSTINFKRQSSCNGANTSHLAEISLQAQKKFKTDSQSTIFTPQIIAKPDAMIDSKDHHKK